MTNLAPTIDQIVKAMSDRATEILNELFENKTFQVPQFQIGNESWNVEHFNITTQLIADVTCANSDVRDFNVTGNVVDNIMLLSVKDNAENTIADVICSVTKKKEEYTIDSVQVAFKVGAFIAPKETQPVISEFGNEKKDEEYEN